MTMEHPTCEICGKPATVAMTDIEECTDFKTGVIHSRPFGEPHYFCDDHDREPRIFKGPPINWPYDVPNAPHERAAEGGPLDAVVRPQHEETK